MSHGVHNAAHQDRVHGQMYPGDSKLQQSHLQGREELKEHSWGRSICRLAPAILLEGNESSLSLLAILKQETKNFQKVEKKLTTEYVAL